MNYSCDYRYLEEKGREVVVGVERFELPTSCSQSLQQGKMGILGNCVFATFSKNIKQLTYVVCQSEIPLNSSSIPYESEVLLPICYQIFDGDSDKGVEKYSARMGLWRVSDCEELVGITHRII